MTYGLVGEKLGHSYSKIIHEALGRYPYELFPVAAEDFEGFIRACDYRGLNVTIPYKKSVMPLCDEIDAAAKKIGAVNTLYFRDGRLHGTNTDYTGFLYMAKRAGISFANRSVLILGNGGTSLTVRAAVRDSHASEIFVASRSADPACISYDELPEKTEIIINTTPVGTYPDNGAHLLDLSRFPACRGVLDVIYNPFITDLLFRAREKDLPHSNGLPMLVAQATAAAEFFTGEKDLQSENERIIELLEGSMKNIVLIGMPGCGKTSLGRRLAESLARPFVDMDEEIEKMSGRTIPEIFREDGEPAFRKMENTVAKTLGKEHSQVIAAGGGAVLNSDNIHALKQNGTVVFIDRPVNQLDMCGRPLSKDLTALKTMYEQRLPLYRQYSDFRISNEGSPDDALSSLVPFFAEHRVAK